jgi:hypothetical protein
MPFLMPARGGIEALGRLVGDTYTNGDTLVLRLFKNGINPAKGDSAPRFTAATGAGYAPIRLGSAVATPWTITYINPGVGDTAQAVCSQQTFTFTGADSIAGYYITAKSARYLRLSGQAGDTVVICAEKFGDGPYVVPSGGGTVKVTPKINSL